MKEFNNIDEFNKAFEDFIALNPGIAVVAMVIYPEPVAEGIKALEGRYFISINMMEAPLEAVCLAVHEGHKHIINKILADGEMIPEEKPN